MEETIEIKAKVAEPTKKILEDIKWIYQENYTDLSEEQIYGYMIEDMLEAYLEGSEEEVWEDETADEEN